MVDAYNLTNLSKNFDIISHVSYVNEQTGGAMVLILLISIFLIIFISTKNYESKRSFATATYITTVLSVLFSSLGWISIYVTVVLIIATAGATILLVTENG